MVRYTALETTTLCLEGAANRKKRGFKWRGDATHCFTDELRGWINTNKDPFKIPESYISKILSSKISRIDALLLSEDYFLFNHSHKHDLC